MVDLVARYEVLRPFLGFTFVARLSWLPIERYISLVWLCTPCLSDIEKSLHTVRLCKANGSCESIEPQNSVFERWRIFSSGSIHIIVDIFIRISCGQSSFTFSSISAFEIVEAPDSLQCTTVRKLVEIFAMLAVPALFAYDKTKLVRNESTVAPFVLFFVRGLSLDQPKKKKKMTNLSSLTD